ncbi:DUF551 domain-containing protein [Brucella intermedia GD04153]|uniref:DUF551 domain-containing protein n=1 Tax=Brucella intermedia GD04153 TaxID=2975438 RepID=A0AA42KL58_9HYPH|nr:hypothetical protein [Brucella intermedia]MDH0125468.1 DUF551 domain-containing protein [Brucella intermedia GD04153]
MVVGEKAVGAMQAYLRLKRYILPSGIAREALQAALPFIAPPTAAHQLALEEAAQVLDAKAEEYEKEARDLRGSDRDRRFCSAVAVRLRGSANEIRALSSPDHADAGKVEGDGWLPIETAPKNKAIQIYIPNADYYGNDGIYAGILVDLGTGQRWATFGWAVARDLPPHMHPTHWRPLPSAPSQEAAGS